MRPISLMFVLFACYAQNAVSEKNIEFMDKQTASLNKYIDQVLTNLHDVGKEIGVEPLLLPNQTKEFEHKMWFTTIKGVFSLNDGLLSNLSSVVRAKDVTLTYDDRELELVGAFEFPLLKIDYNFITQLNDFGPRGTMHGYLKSLQISGKLKVNTKTFKITLEDLDFPEAGEISFKVDVSTLFNFFVNTLSEIVTTVFKLPMLFIVKHVIKDTIQKKLDNLLENEYYVSLINSVALIQQQ